MGVKDLESPVRTIQNRIPLETFDEMYDTDDASPSARDNESVLSAGTSPSTEFTNVSPTQYPGATPARRCVGYTAANQKFQAQAGMRGGAAGPHARANATPTVLNL